MKSVSFNKLLSVLLAAFMVLTAIPAMAADDDEDKYPRGSIYIGIDNVNIAGDHLTISGRYSDLNKGLVVSALLSKANEEPSYVGGTVLAASVAANDPGTDTSTAWRDFIYTINLYVPDSVPTGDYRVTVGTSISDTTASLNFKYLGADDRNALVGVYNSADVTPASLKAQLDALPQPLTVDSLGADGTAYRSLSANGKLRFAKLMLDLGEEFKAGDPESPLPEREPLTSLEFTDLMRFSREALLLSAIDSSYEDRKGYDNALNVFKAYAPELLGIDPETNTNFNKVFNADNFVKAVKAQHRADFNKASEITSVVDSALNFAVLNETSHLAYIDYLKKNVRFFGANNEDLLDELNHASRNTTVLGYYGEALRENLPVYSFEDFDKAWAKTITTAENRYRNATSSGSSGGSGGGGGGGGGRGTVSGGNHTSADANLVVNPARVRDDPLDKKLLLSEYYSDIDGYEWAFAAILSLTQDGIVSGTGNNKFEPARTLKREEFMKLLVNAFDLADMKATCSFSDVDKDAWYYMYIASAEQAGITSGRGDGTFGIGDDVTREEMATLVYRAAVKAGAKLAPAAGNSNFNYSDIGSLSPYAVEAVQTLAFNGIMAGETGELYAPKTGASRAQAAVVIYNAKNFK